MVWRAASPRERRAGPAGLCTRRLVTMSAIWTVHVWAGNGWW